MAQAGGTPDACREGGDGGIWSLASRGLFTGTDFPLVNVPLRAPDGRAALKYGESGMYVEGAQGRTPLVEMPLTQALIEGQWSPDSAFLAITDSDGGNVGQWITRFYAVGRDGRTVPIDILRDVSHDAARLPQCYEWEPPNLALAGWKRGGREALVIAQVPPHSNCRNMGETRGYRISVPGGRILAKVRDPASHVEWRTQLGCNYATGH
jgi:hypothetical protein